MRALLTDAKGRPLPVPQPPSKGASTPEHINYLRAVHAYNDRVTDIGNEAFNAAFRIQARGIA